MPPKKKSGKKKKKEGFVLVYDEKGRPCWKPASVPKVKDGELTVDDKYKKTLEEIEALKDHLAIRKEMSRRSQSAAGEWKDKVLNAEDSLREHEETQRAVSADMTRQYKTMQTEMGLRIHQLEAELQRTHSQLDYTEASLKKTREEKEQMELSKDQEIAELNARITTMGTKYEIILNEAMNDLEEQITNAKKVWEHDATLIQGRNKQTLLEFGLNPLDL